MKFSCMITHIRVFELLLLSLSGETPCNIKASVSDILKIGTEGIFLQDLRRYNLLFRDFPDF